MRLPFPQPGSSSPDLLLAWLKTEAPDALNALWAQADAVRREQVGDSVHFRGLIEISNRCERLCAYCGLRRPNRALPRYRMTLLEILESARLAVEIGCGTVVLQSGEDFSWTREEISEIIREIRSNFPVALTLSLGERTPEDLEAWRKAGADRYLLRFETSNRALLNWIHPPSRRQSFDRFDLLRHLKRLGYQVGSGVMVGLPGQRLADLAQDLRLFEEFDLDMVGIGPFIPHPDTPLGASGLDANLSTDLVDPSGTALKALALTRLLLPHAHLPSTTALEVADPGQGRILGLTRGANVVMPNVTPAAYRRAYDIYPGKTAQRDDPRDLLAALCAKLHSIGRTPGKGRGDARPRPAGPSTARQECA